jgi:capsular polysaccharide biosynthesis protein
MTSLDRCFASNKYISMELKNIIKTIKKHKSYLIVSSTVGLIIAIGYLLLPVKYYAVGSIFIGRSIDVSFRYFTYEGYYGQQTAVSYTNTVASLLESPDVAKQTLQLLNQPVNQDTLKKLKRDLTIKKASPQSQIITITVKSNTSNKAKETWNALTSAISNTTTTVNNKSDPYMQIVKVSPEPLIKEEFKSPFVFIPAGLLLGYTIGIFLICLKEYFTEGKNK